LVLEEINDQNLGTFWKVMRHNGILGIRVRPVCCSLIFLNHQVFTLINQLQEFNCPRICLFRF